MSILLPTLLLNIQQQFCLYYYYDLQFYYIFPKNPTCIIIPDYIINIFYEKILPTVLFGSTLLFGSLEYVHSTLKGICKCRNSLDKNISEICPDKLC